MGRLINNDEGYITQLYQMHWFVGYKSALGTMRLAPTQVFPADFPSRNWERYTNSIQQPCPISLYHLLDRFPYYGLE